MPDRKPEVPAIADDPAESQRFIETAREVEVDESPEAFDRAFERVVLKRNTKNQHSKGRSFLRLPPV